MLTNLEGCRICGNPRLEQVLDLGVQYLTGLFPRSVEENISKGPLQLVKCSGDSDSCGLLQMRHSFEAKEMYGENYGYRSGLNQSMVDHLRAKINKIANMAELCEGDLVIDIGSNDATTLKAYPDQGLRLVGIDPTGIKFREYYPPTIELIADFFSQTTVRNKLGDVNAKVITSFSMFYDLEDPLEFMRQIYNLLENGGLWIFEQSYMPTMLKKNSYDTVCHEHLEYYSLQQVVWMADRVGFSLVDVEFNDINGGSFSVVAEKSVAGTTAKHSDCVYQLLEMERRMGLETLSPFIEFANRVKQNRDELVDFVKQAKLEGKVVAGLGASTKGNVILQYCDFGPDDIVAIGEVNQGKFGCFTPGSNIPIIPESELVKSDPDYIIVFPWHFRHFFECRDNLAGSTLVFPIPELSMTML